MNLENGYYWVHCKFNKRNEIVEIEDGWCVLRCGTDDEYPLEDFDFGPDPKPIEKPEWCE